MDSLDEDLTRLGTILVEERVLRRIIKGHRKVRGVGLQVPHEQCYTLPRAELEKLVEGADVAVDLTTLPERVIIVSGARTELDKPEERQRLWRAIFHARIHQLFDERLARGEVTVAAIRERVNRIGQTEFDEIRTVLRQEDLLFPPVNDTATYIEFVALYLELCHFAPNTLHRTFPALFDTAHVDATIALDLDGAALLAASRPAGAPEQPVIAVPRAETQQPPRLAFADPSARKAAASARRRGNRSRAAILASRSGDAHGARTDLDELVARLAKALDTTATTGWAEALLPVAQYAARERPLRFSPGARLLYDLQAACVVAEQQVKVVDFVGWAISLGKQPIVRPLPATREVRVAKHVHAAEAELPSCGVDTVDDRTRLSEVLHEISAAADANVRKVSRPKIEAALDEVGLHPHSLPERVGEKKLVDELLDRAVEIGRLSLPQLRDAISKNDLKCNELTLSELRDGDQLLRCDRILSHSLDGVYRRGEGYLRLVQKISSVLFGTKLGRLLTLYLMLPMLGAIATLEGLQHTVGLLIKKLFHYHIELIQAESFGEMLQSPSVLGVAAFLLLMLHVPLFRRGVVFSLRMFGRGLRFALWRAPRALWRHPLMQSLLDSRFTRFVIKPAIPAGIVALVIQDIYRWPAAGAVFLAFAVLLNSRFGRLVEEYVTDWAVRSGRQFASRILPGLIKYVLELFVKLVELLDRAIYRVDEWLRFKAGQSRIRLVIKGVLGTIWFLITYILRFYVNLFIEPTTNPIKHFPVVTVAAKIMIPIIPSILDGVSGAVTPLFGSAVGSSFAGFTVLVLPGFAGFLVWELKENWKLYRSTRAKMLHPLAIGHHGESMIGFMKPGFHSGTIPKLYTKLRRAAWRDNERAVARQKLGLHHVEEAIWNFVDRQLVSMLNEVAAFRVTDVALSHVELGSNRVQIELVCPSVGSEPLTIRFEQQSGWLVANLPRTGWVAGLDAHQRGIFEIALAGFYKLSGVELVREQLEHVLRGSAKITPAYDIADEGIVVWPGNGYDTELVYDLRTKHVVPTVRGTPFEDAVPELVRGHALFFREPLYWSVWSTAWQQIARGEPPMPLLVGPSLVGAPGKPLDAARPARSIA
jgi:hypothetical protein